ncbi:MAG: hypothetical protein BA863_03515 [Desulfovibrio sp. S3730MH75]|nr:MAG: hypothetical protein BA863_03515 [Desulfovibrio sp. S3730MH75]
MELLELKSKTSIIARAKREGWQSQPRPGRGGGSLWVVQSMPESTREQISAALYQRMKAEQPESLTPSVPPLPAVLPIHLATWQREIMEARLILLAEIKRIAVIEGIMKAEKLFAKMAKTGELSTYYKDLIAKANARQGKARALSASTLRNWRRINNNEGPNGLAPKTAQISLDKKYPAWLMPFLDAYQIGSKPSLAYIHGKLQNRLNLPSLRTVERKVYGLGEVARNKGRMGSKDIKKLKAFVRRDTSGVLPTDIYSADGTVADMYAIKPENGTLFRPEITTIIDISTRVLVGWSVGLAENALDVATALRYAVKNYGVPALFYTDNGPGYKNEFLEDGVMGVLARLAISPEHSVPGSSQSRGIIENLQKLWNREARVSGSYCGRDMDRDAAYMFLKKTRKELKEDGVIKSAPTLKDFVLLIKQWAEEYNNTPHSSLPKVYDPKIGKKRNQTPLEGWADKAPKAEIFYPEEWELKDMLRPHIMRMVRRCELSVYGQTYFSKELEAYHEKYVNIGIDIHDGQSVQVRDLKGHFICDAGFEANKKAYYPQSYMERKRDQRATGREKVLDNRRDEIRSERSGIAGELTAAPVVQKLKMTPEQEAIQAELMVEFENERNSKVIDIRPVEKKLIPDDPKEQFKLALKLEEQISRGMEIETELALWLGGYQRSAEYKTNIEMCDAFGVAAILG